MIIQSPLRQSTIGATILRLSACSLFFRSVILGMSFGVIPVATMANEMLSLPDDLKKLSVEELMNIEVTSVSKRPERLSDAASAIQVITSDDIRRSGATTIPEALRLATNLQVAQKGSSKWGITARGFNTDLANKLLVLMDGRTIYTPLYSGVFWDRQNYLLEDIDRIEVISGPGGTLWGANAVNGVINIITKRASATKGLYLETGRGTINPVVVGGRYGAQLSPRANLRVYGKYFDQHPATYPGGSDALDAWGLGQAGFRLDAEPSTNSAITFQGDYYPGEQGVLTGGEAAVSGANILGRWTHTFSDNSDATLQLYYDQTFLSLPTPELIINGFNLAPAGKLEDDLDTYDADFQHRFQIGQNQTVVWGLGYRLTHDELKNSPSLAFYPEILDQHLYSTFVQDEIKLQQDFSLTLGSKFEHNDYTGWEIVPSARLQWELAAQHLLWMAVSRAVRTPSRIDRDLAEPDTSSFLVILSGGSKFRSETVVAYELGYRSQIRSNVAASLAVFYNNYDRIRSTSLTPGTIFPLFFSNDLEGESYGFELTTNYQPRSWCRLRLGFNMLETDLRVVPGGYDFNATLNETADPKYQFSLRSSTDLSRQVSLDGGLRWIDVLRNNNGPVAGSVPSYWELDLRLAYAPADGLELSFTGRNLLHDYHAEYGYPGASREELRRSVLGKLSWRLW